MHRTCEWPDTEILSPLHLAIQRGRRPSSTRVCLSFLCVFCGQHSLSNPSSQAGSASLPPTLSKAQFASLLLFPVLQRVSTRPQRTATFPKQVSSNHKNLLYILPEEARSQTASRPAKATSCPASPSSIIPAPSISSVEFPKLMLLSFYSKDTKIFCRDWPCGGTLNQKDPAALISEARVE